MSAGMERSPNHASNRKSRFSESLRAVAENQARNEQIDRRVRVIRGQTEWESHRKGRYRRVRIEVTNDRRRKQSP